MKSSILDKEPVQRVVALLLEAEAAVEESPTTSGHGSAASASALRIIDAFDFPKFRYDAIKKLFHRYVMSFPKPTSNVFFLNYEFLTYFADARQFL